MAGVISQRKYLTYVEQTIKLHKEFPPPVPRSRRSPEGFSDWLKWIDSEREAQRLPEYQGVYERYPIVWQRAYLAFDHRWWKKGHEVVFWHRDQLRSVPPDMVRGFDAKAATKDASDAEAFDRDFRVF